MSALIRYFLAKGYPVAGYDKTPSPLTKELIKKVRKSYTMKIRG